MTTPASHISRRTLAKGAAWSVPAVAVVAAAPAYAQSVMATAPTDVTATRTDCNTASVSWKGVAGETYQVEYSANGQDWSSAGTAIAGANGAGTATVTASGTIIAVRVRHVASSDGAFSEWVNYTIPAPAAPVVTSAQRDSTWFIVNFYAYDVAWTGPSGSYTLELSTNGTAVSATFSNVESPWSYENSLGSWTSSLYTHVRVRTTVCGQTVQSAWQAFNVLRSFSGQSKPELTDEEARAIIKREMPEFEFPTESLEQSSVGSPSSTARATQTGPNQARAIQTPPEKPVARSVAPAEPIRTPSPPQTARSTASPASEPTPTVSAPEPAPVVTEPVAPAPEPTPAATPSA